MSPCICQAEWSANSRSALIGESRPGTLVYACGPEALLVEIEQAMSGWPPGSLHLEWFAPKDRSALNTNRHSFEVELVQSGLRMHAPAGKSILEAVEEAGISVPSSCREGTCGTREPAIFADIARIADHRDSVLSQAEQDENESMMICVSRAKTTILGTRYLTSTPRQDPASA